MIGKAIRELRIERKLTQQELSDLSGIPQTTIGSIEIGRSKPGADTMVKLANTFGVTTDEIYRRAGMLPADGITETGPSYGDEVIEKLVVLARMMDTQHRALLLAIAETIIEHQRQDDS